MVKFKTEPTLGPTIKNVTTWSFGFDPIRKIEDIAYAAGARMHSQLCGYRFISANPNQEYPEFWISFVSKIRSKIGHTAAQVNPSQWFIFKKIEPFHYDVLSKELLFVNYGFDIDAFMESDVFNAMIPKFEALVRKGITKDIPEFVKTLNPKKQSAEIKEIERYRRAIAEALPYIKNKSYMDKYFKLNITQKDKKYRTNYTDKQEQRMVDRFKKADIYSDANKDDEEYESEIDEKIEGEFKKRGIYSDISNTTIEETEKQIEQNAEKIKEAESKEQNEKIEKAFDEVKDISDDKDLKDAFKEYKEKKSEIIKKLPKDTVKSLEKIEKFIDDNLNSANEAESKKKHPLNTFIRGCVRILLWLVKLTGQSLIWSAWLVKAIGEITKNTSNKLDKYIKESNEDDEITEDSHNYDTIIKKEKGENGQDVFAIYTKTNNLWIATFPDEESAEAFAQRYPTLLKNYLQKAMSIESDVESTDEDDSFFEDDAENINEVDNIENIFFKEDDVSEADNEELDENDESEKTEDKTSVKESVDLTKFISKLEQISEASKLIDTYIKG